MNKLIFDIRQSVFPLYKGSEANGKLIDLNFLVTCFFMKLGRWIVLFTARHNLNIQLPQNEHYVVAERTNDDTNPVTITGVFTKKLSEDVSFVLVDSDTLKSFKKPVVPLDLHEVQLNMGTDVF